MTDTQARERAARHLEEYYGFSPKLEEDFQRQKTALSARVIAKLDAYVDRCIANREEPDFTLQSVAALAEDEEAERSATPAAKSRYVMYQLIKKVTALRVAAISEAARADGTVDLPGLVKALGAKEKAAAAATTKELKALLGAKPTVDTAAQVLVGLHINPAQQLNEAGYWDYICRNRCCFWGWRCSWGCLLIGCWLRRQ